MEDIVRSHLLLVVVSGLLTISSFVVGEDIPISRLSFETDVAGENLKYEEGISGRGVLISPDTKLRFPVKNSISLDKGTISLWIKPVNWNASCLEGYMLICLFDSAESPIGGWARHHDSRTLGISLYLKGEDPTWLGFGSDPNVLEKWMCKTWHNAVFTFSQEEFAIYLDTVRTGGCAGEKARQLWQRLQQACYFQPGSAYKGTDFCSVVDEISIYDVVVSEEEMSQAFKKMVLDYLE